MEMSRQDQTIELSEDEKAVRILGKNFHDCEQHFFAILDAAQNGILAVDREGIILIANRVFQEMIGLPERQVIGRQISEIVPHTLLPSIIESQKPLLGQKIVVGSTVVMANYSPIVVSGEIVGAVSVFQDISILDNTSTELSYVKALIHELEAIINSSYDGIFITDGQGVVLRCNEAYERMTGIACGEVTGKTMKQLVEEKYYDQSVTLMVMEKRERITIKQSIKGEGRFLITGNPIFDAAGNLFRVVTNVRDIAELVNLRDQLSETKAQSLRYKQELSHLRSLHLDEDEIVFRSTAMAQAIATAIKVAEVDSTVIITGDSGTGKELIAKLIHKKGKGSGRPFIKINCAALPESLLESELFGYEGGAFTGAKKEGKPGLFELAHNGTLFLDEIGDMPMVLQVKLLRAIQNKEIIRVGGATPIAVNVRIIAATHRDMAKMITAGTFRQDLYYRLMVVPIHLAPLRDRKEDIPLLVMHFLDKYNRHFGFAKTFSPEVVDKLSDYAWPGNVRELENIIERMLVTSTDEHLTSDYLPEALKRKVMLPRRGTKLKEAVKQTEAELLSDAYREYSSWHKVAIALGVDKSTVFRKAAKYGLLDR